jgi:beta-fructofuranosidase
MALSGWMNDPCGLGFDLVTGMYHVAFQWNHTGNDWGNIAWGWATSKDLVTWNVSSKACLSPDALYDRCGVFSGCLVPADISKRSNSTLTYFYTSVSKLPIHYTLPYVYGSETLSMATSRDGGRTWQKDQGNPFLPGPPSGVDVTGWRDPFVSAWPALSKFLGIAAEEDVLFGCIAGGIKDQTPTAFLYSIRVANLKAWKYMGPLVNVGLNKRLSRWSGDLGTNWEVVNFATLTNDLNKQSMNIMIMGCEGCLPASSILAGQGSCSDISQQRTRRSQLWTAGRFQRSVHAQDGLIALDFGGIFDHGCFYAANSFWDPTVRGHVVVGWITEEDLPDELRYRQGWSGLLSLPRLLGVMTIPRVTHARVSALDGITSVQAIPDTENSFNIVTLKIEPHPNLGKLRESKVLIELPPFELFGSVLQQPLLNAQSVCWELESEIAVTRDCERVGLIIDHSEGRVILVTATTGQYFLTLSFHADSTASTKLYLDLVTEEFIIDRGTGPVINPRINRTPERAPHTLFTRYDVKEQQEVEESLHIRAFYDTSVLEVFVNSRTVISTRIYSASDKCFGVNFFAIASPSASAGMTLARVKSARLWDGLSQGISPPPN